MFLYLYWKEGKRGQSGALAPETASSSVVVTLPPSRPSSLGASSAWQVGSEPPTPVGNLWISQAEGLRSVTWVQLSHEW